MKIWLLLILWMPFCFGHNIEKSLHQLEPLTHIQYDIAPRSFHYYQKRGQSASTLQPKTIEHDDQLRLTLNVYNTTFHLHLEPNHDIFHPDAVIHQDGKSTPMFLHKVYKGHVVHTEKTNQRWIKEKAGLLHEDASLGWARILVRHDLMHDHQPIIEGAFQYLHDLYHIKVTENYRLVKRTEDPHHPPTNMVIYRESDTTFTKRDTQQSTCGFDTVEQPTLEKHTTLLGRGGLLNKRFENGCPTTKKINYMGAAADCTYVQHYKSRDAARIQIINDFNMASAIFEETFNIALGLINITIMDPTCPQLEAKTSWNRVCDANYSLGDRLSDFSRWRATMKNDGAGLWHLMTNCPTGVEVGLAWLQQLCNTKANLQTSTNGKQQYVSGAGVSAITREEWKVLAHEIGHGFGAIHDCNADACPCLTGNCDCCPLDETTCNTGGGFLMTPISNATAQGFSPGSIKTICNAFPSIGHCLSDPQEHTRTRYQLNTCGNGIKEEGEECDTGGVDTDCCNASTCKLKPQAVCEDEHDTCCHQCQIQPSTHMCRPAATPCDIAEYCTGTSATCPNDVYIKDGVSCGDRGLRCASGQCTSRDQQCLARGFVMNITQSCQSDFDECNILCEKPEGGKCLKFSGNFMDGTPCGQGGQCLSGVCNNSSPASLVWVKQHLNIVIPACCIAFLFVLTSCLLFFWFGCLCCTGYREKRRLGTKMPLKKSDSALQVVPTHGNHPPKSSSSSMTMVAMEEKCT